MESTLASSSGGLLTKSPKKHMDSRPDTGMFAKLKKKIAEEAATAPRPGGAARIPRSFSKESITSVGADSGDDFPSDGSSSREDLSSQLFRRNEQIRKLEVKLSDYAEQVRNLQKMKEKLEIALEKHQDSSLRKLQEQNEAHQASTAKMAEGMALALEKKDQEWREKLSHLEKLLKKEESLGQMERELESSRKELARAQDDLQTSSSLSSRLAAELQELRQQHADLEAERDELLDAEESAKNKITDLEQRSRELQAYIHQMSVNLQNKPDLDLESTKSEETISSVKHQCAEQVRRLEEQVATLKAAQEAEMMVAQRKISKLEKENEELKDSHRECENSSRRQETELERLKAELSSRETVNVEIANALEETQNHKEDLQQQVADLSLLLKEKDWLIKDKTDTLLKKEEELRCLRQGHEELRLQMQQLQIDLELCQRQAAEREAVVGEQMSTLQEQLREQLERRLTSEGQTAELELASRALKKQLHPAEDGGVEPNGEVVAADTVQLQKENRELEQQIAEKNKMIKQLQQRMAELKKTLQKELKIRPDSEVPEVSSAALTVTNNSDLNDSREINFEYLKHVVLKFMSCRESEAFHLIKAVSVLLNFSQEEESMLKETLEYKMSWFGSKPSPRGSIRPSISSPRSPWS